MRTGQFVKIIVNLSLIKIAPYGHRTCKVRSVQGLVSQVFLDTLIHRTRELDPTRPVVARPPIWPA